MTDHNWTDPDRPPVPDATDHGGGVWSSPAPAGSDYTHGLWLWHWCTQSITAQRAASFPGEWPAMWKPGGVGLHTLVSREPLHLEPSVYWSDCCGVHGFLRAGRWEAV